MQENIYIKLPEEKISKIKYYREIQKKNLEAYKITIYITFFMNNLLIIYKKNVDL